MSQHNLRYNALAKTQQQLYDHQNHSSTVEPRSKRNRSDSPFAHKRKAAALAAAQSDINCRDFVQNALKNVVCERFFDLFLEWLFVLKHCFWDVVSLFDKLEGGVVVFALAFYGL